MKRGRNQRRRQGGGPNPNRALDSNGPDVRIRGTANQIFDKYQGLARDAASAGDRVRAENYLQHAEHYFRLIKSMQPAQAPAPSSEMVDVDGEQPSIEDEMAKPRSNGSAAEIDAAADQPEEVEAKTIDATDDEAGSAADATSEHAVADGSPAEEKKVKRRRTRRAPKKDAAEEEAPGAAEEAVAS